MLSNNQSNRAAARHVKAPSRKAMVWSAKAPLSTPLPLVCKALVVAGSFEAGSLVSGNAKNKPVFDPLYWIPSMSLLLSSGLLSVNLTVSCDAKMLAKGD